MEKIMTKTILELQVGAPGMGGTGDVPRYVQLKKSFYLPFTPQVGLELWFAPLELDPTNSAKFASILASKFDLAEVIISIKRVTYHIDSHVFRLQSSQWYESSAGLDSVVEQFILGFGFELDEF